MSSTEIAYHVGIKDETSNMRKDIELIGCIHDFLTQIMIPFELQKCLNTCRIDLYLPDQRLALEI